MTPNGARAAFNGISKMLDISKRSGSSSSGNNRSTEIFNDNVQNQVQVNAFADELQTALRGGVTPPSANALVRRLSAGGSPTTPNHLVVEDPLGNMYTPKVGYERNTAHHPGNRKIALARALEKANLRLFGGYRTFTTNQSPPNIGNTFPGAGPSSLILGTLISMKMMRRFARD
ncbi:hypothetical protein BZA77DRAFT_363154 [Pyronema omphalodes]|nr:hypothetical protein BZA77DRAFT_363154 [Pyronema omphalodes]